MAAKKKKTHVPLAPDPFAPLPPAPIGIHPRVLKVVKDWANMAGEPNDDDLLQVLFTGSGRHIPFPDAASILITNLKAEFKRPPARHINFQGSDINPPGNIKSVADLTTAVIQSS